MQYLKNRYQFEKYIKGYLISSAFWYVINALYLLIRYDALQFYNRFIDNNEFFIIHSELKFALLANAVLALFLGWFSWNFYFFLDKRSKLKSWKRGLLIFAIVSVETSLLLSIGDYMGKNIYPEGLPYFNELSQQSFVIYAIYVMMAGALINSLFQLKDILGPELFQTALKGDYYTPKEEHRVFMFLDLYNSTSIAECLGHMKYSRLIQDCYRTMTDPISFSKASVYQYVGDEIVLTWPLEKGIKNNRCIQLFYDIDATLKSRRDYFMEKYGVMPEFKAGIHAGIVATSQVGVIKREVAYHGDTVNATSRLQEKCKELGYQVLMSEDVVNLLHSQFKEVGTHQFRGKKQPLKIFTTEDKPHANSFTHECPSIESTVNALLPKKVDSSIERI
ncbi:adenylate/guanylate cyclase domain-containing protein [Flammeovirga sp. OC4]|uniref:adenylate/guanylate cyclase domain-containing protein n=1 Tax=Flammeovirga sp. OC4 TaxID=1382345 RepID=UPI000693B7DE|nr:adenylate/guanylate cyclase domain-containing protein [Flammeovirga sp. OC4]